MIVAIGALVSLAVLLGMLVRFSIKRNAGSAALPAGAWDAARSAEPSQVGRMLLGASKPIANAVPLNPQTALYRTLSTKLAATGTGLYGGSVEVFLSVQVAALLIGTGVLAFLPLTGLTGAPLFVAWAGALALAIYPMHQVHDAGKKRMEHIREELPEFAELLLMPISSGYGIIPALHFTANRTTGVVSTEVKTLLGLLSSRAASEAEIFQSTGQRLGDAAAATFFNTLYQSYTDGVKVTDTIRGQATQLRHQEHQRKREAVKAVPNKLVFIIALHLLPFLFVLVGLPAVYMLGSMA